MAKASAPSVWLERQLEDGRKVRLGFKQASKSARLTPVMLLLEDPRGITSASLRDLPIGEIDRDANAPASRTGAASWEELSQSPVRRPTSIDERERFHVHVAARYFRLLEDTHRPAALMAEESDVPVATVHRWIRETRRAGHLPPARKGAAG